jgi:putative ABC transport system permease protein
VIASSVNAVSTVSSELTSLFGNDVRVTTVSSILSTVESVTSSTGTLLASIGSISVLVAFIAIMTTEFTSVMERTKEIGILKALGASARTILVNFISESLVVGLLGGLIGAGLGSALSFFIIGFLSGNSIPGIGRALGGGGARGAFAASPSSATTLHITPVITPELILLAVGLATLVGGLAGLLPAWRASRLTPVEALREA